MSVMSGIESESDSGSIMNITVRIRLPSLADAKPTANNKR